MSRPEAPIDRSGPLGKFAEDLRALRISSGLSYREMAGGQSFSHSTMSKAAAGKQLPTLEVTLAYVRACRGDEDQWTRRWHGLLNATAVTADGGAVSSPRPGRSRQRSQQTPGKAGSSPEGVSTGRNSRFSTRVVEPSEVRSASRERTDTRAESSKNEASVDAQFTRAMQSGDCGPEYRDALNTLVAYGLRVVGAWIRTGRIFQECAAGGRYVSIPAWFDPDDVDDLIAETVTDGLALFQGQLDKQKWDPRLGASSTTYFVGSCTLAFPNVLRRHAGSRGSRGLHTPIGAGGDLDLLDDQFADSHEDAVIVRSDLVSAMAEMTGVHRKVLWGSAMEMSHADIAIQVGLTPRAVEGQLRRARAELRRRLSRTTTDSRHHGKACAQDAIGKARGWSRTC
jgi:DNA-directed RNA polymerase specialized sigma24 family protein